MKKLYRTYVLLSILVFPFFLSAQTGSVELRGKVTDGKGVPLAGASVSLSQVKKGVSIFNVSTDGSGNFSMKAPLTDVVLIIRHLGYLPFKTTVFPEGMLTVKLLEDTRQLAEVSVKAERDFIEQQLDRVVVNVAGDPKNGLNALDIFRKIPGLTLNGTDIMFEGKQVAVTIDGRSTRLSGADLQALLNSTSTTGIAQVEVLFSPSAKYDAAGSGGIINIKRLIREKPGYDVTTGITLGHGWKYLSDNGIDAAVNIRKGANYLSGSYGFGIGKRYHEIQTNTDLLAAKQYMLDSSIYISPAHSHNLRLSWDHYLTKKNIFGVLLTAYSNERSSAVNAETRIFDIDQTQPNSNLLSETNTTRNSKGFNVNMNLKLILDSTKQQEITMDADAGVFRFKSANVLQVFEEWTPVSSLQQETNQLAESPSAIYSYKADYTQKLYKGVFEAGVKGSYTSIDNALVSVGRFSGQATTNLGSNDYNYKETILATYGSTRQVFGRFSLQLGVRIEQTVTMGDSRTLDSLVNRSYLNIFPNVNLGYKSGGGSVSFSYSRRMERPAYNYLNPFDIPNSVYSSTRGNPYLKPSFSDNYRLGFNPGKRWSFALSYSKVKDVITDLNVLNDETRITTSMKANMNSNRRTGVSISYSSQLSKIWTLNYNVGTAFSQYRFDYGNLLVDVEQFTSYAALDNRITLPKTWWLGLYFYGATKATFGNRINQPYYMVNLSGGKKMFKGRANLSISCNDIFFSSITRSTASYGNVQSSYKSKYDSRNVRVGFSYNFGSGKVDMRKRSPGSADEQRRNQS